MSEPATGVHRPLPAPAPALILVTSCVATTLMLAGGLHFVDGAPDLSAGLGRMMLFPVLAAFVLFVLAAMTGAVVGAREGRERALLAGLVGIIAGGVLASMALGLSAPELSGPWVVGLAAVWCVPYLFGFMFGGAVASGLSVPPASHGEGPRWPAP